MSKVAKIILGAVSALVLVVGGGDGSGRSPDKPK